MPQLKPIPLDQIKGHLQAIRDNISQTPDNNPFQIFEPFGINEKNLPEQEKLLNTVYRKLAPQFHPDKRQNEAKEEKELNDECWNKLSKAYQALQNKLKNANNINIYSADAENFPDDGAPRFQANPGFKMEDFIKEFKDFYKQKAGKDFSEKEAGEEGYSFQSSQDSQGNRILVLSFPNSALRDNFVQRLLDKNMMHSAVPALKGEAGEPEVKNKESTPTLTDSAEEPASSLPSAFNPRATPSLKPSSDEPSSGG